MFRYGVGFVDMRGLGLFWLERRGLWFVWNRSCCLYGVAVVVENFVTGLKMVRAVSGLFLGKGCKS
jgi:hypothetical protein